MMNSKIYHLMRLMLYLSLGKHLMSQLEMYSNNCMFVMMAVLVYTQTQKSFIMNHVIISLEICPVILYLVIH